MALVSHHTVPVPADDSTCKRWFFKFVCGFHSGSPDDAAEATAMKLHLQDLSSLKQSKAEKIVLGVGVAVVLAIGVAMYVFWSLYDFHEAPYYPINATHLLPGDAPDVAVI